MKRFLVKVVVWLLIFSLAVFLLTLGFEKRLEQCSNRTMIEHCPEYDLLIVGSSRARCHINPIFLDSTLGTNSFNLGFDNCQFDYQTVRLQQYLSICTKTPHTVLWCIDFLTMGQSVGYASEYSFPFAYYDSDFVRTLKAKPGFQSSLYNITDAAFFQFVFHRYLWKRQIEFPRLISLNMESATKGYEGLWQSWNGSEYEKIDTIEVEFNPITKVIFEEELLALKKQGINVIFVYTPLYYRVFDKIVNLDRMYATYDSIAQNHNIPILDYSLCYLSKDTSYFSIALHLNSQGSGLFSEMLAKDLDSLSLIKF